MTDRTARRLHSIDAVEQGLGSVGYIASRQISTAVYLAQQLQKPILVEGPAGVGKTELACSLAVYLELPLIGLQCYEGLDEAKALYEWKYGKQLLYTQILKDKISHLFGEADGLDAAFTRLHSFSDVSFSKQFLEPRTLLRALEQPEGAVRADDRSHRWSRRLDGLQQSRTAQRGLIGHVGGHGRNHGGI